MNKFFQMLLCCQRHRRTRTPWDFGDFQFLYEFTLSNKMNSMKGGKFSFPCGFRLQGAPGLHRRITGVFDVRSRLRQSAQEKCTVLIPVSRRKHRMFRTGTADRAICLALDCGAQTAVVFVTRGLATKCATAHRIIFAHQRTNFEYFCFVSQCCEDSSVPLGGRQKELGIEPSSTMRPFLYGSRSTTSRSRTLFPPAFERGERDGDVGTGEGLPHPQPRIACAYSTFSQVCAERFALSERAVPRVPQRF